MARRECKRPYPENLGSRLPSVRGVPVEYWDERLTTAAAERAMIEVNLSRQKRKKVIDKVAASLILQSWMDSRSPTQGEEE